MAAGEPLVMVQVVDATSIKGEALKEYFLRVPPTTQTAKDGVAWTFGMPENEYDPIIET